MKSTRNAIEEESGTTPKQTFPLSPTLSLLRTYQNNVAKGVPNRRLIYDLKPSWALV
jgi:hypothetical protein